MNVLTIQRVMNSITNLVNKFPELTALSIYNCDFCGIECDNRKEYESFTLSNPIGYTVGIHTAPEMPFNTVVFDFDNAIMDATIDLSNPNFEWHYSGGRRKELLLASINKAFLLKDFYPDKVIVDAIIVPYGSFSNLIERFEDYRYFYVYTNAEKEALQEEKIKVAVIPYTLKVEGE